jgi:flagellar motor switch protein FliN
MESVHISQTPSEFASVLASILTEQMQQAGVVNCQVTAIAAPGAVDSPDPVDEAGETTTRKVAEETERRLHLGFRLQGALAGECYLGCDAASAARLASTGMAVGDAATARTEVRKEDVVKWMGGVLQASCEPFAEALFHTYGTVQVVRTEDDLSGEGMEPVAWLSVATDDGGTALLTLYGDDAMCRGLQRFERVAAVAAASGYKGGNLGLVMDVELNVTLRFGQRQLSLREVMELASGSVVELDREVDEPVDLILDGRVIARGEAVIVDGNYGIRVTEVLQSVML